MPGVGRRDAETHDQKQITNKLKGEDNAGRWGKMPHTHFWRRDAVTHDQKQFTNKVIKEDEAGR
eukprot:1159606-Pelagomonas_calceolata.AAC.7